MLVIATVAPTCQRGSLGGGGPPEPSVDLYSVSIDAYFSWESAPWFYDGVAVLGDDGGYERTELHDRRHPLRLARTVGVLVRRNEALMRFLAESVVRRHNGAVL